MIQSATDIAPATVPAPATPSATSNLGQQDFLTLLTTQLRNQDPLNPMQNTEFLGQMAQFSTVSGIDRMNDNLLALGSGFRDMRLGMASELVGQSVLVPGAVARPDKTGAYRGAVTLSTAAETVEISFSDTVTGAVLHRQILGRQPSGQVEFAWENAPADLTSAGHALRISASATTDGVTEPVASLVYARVLSATLGQSADDITFEVEGFGKLNSLEVETIR
jgi:flagellar basal-body rod modification protein FlgD